MFGRTLERRAGVRLDDPRELRPYLERSGPIGRIAAQAIGTDCRAVRAILFDKTTTTNWSLGWHQDRTICVKQRIEVEGFGPWSVKDGMVHVEPPFNLIAGMVTIRVHIDDVSESNAPLLVARGSHRYGRIPVSEIQQVVGRCVTSLCLARAGDAWLYSTGIVHASDRAITPARRRVLQVDYAASQLPGGLEWLGV